MAAPQTCQACPSPRHSFQNTESKTGPARAAFSQGQGPSPQQGSGHRGPRLGEQSPGGGAAAEDTGDRLRAAPAPEAGSTGQGGLPGTRWASRRLVGRAECGVVGPGLVALRLHPEVGGGAPTAARDQAESEGGATGSGARTWATRRQGRPGPRSSLWQRTYPEGHRPALPGHSPAQPPFTAQGMNAHLKACTRLRSANSWSSTKA